MDLSRIDYPWEKSGFPTGFKTQRRNYKTGELETVDIFLNFSFSLIDSLKRCERYAAYASVSRKISTDNIYTKRGATFHAMVEAVLGKKAIDLKDPELIKDFEVNGEVYKNALVAALRQGFIPLTRENTVVEFQFKFPLFDHEGLTVYFQGKIDFMYINPVNGLLHVVDFKTKNRSDRYMFTDSQLKQSDQLMGYVYALYKIGRLKRTDDVVIEMTYFILEGGTASNACIKVSVEEAITHWNTKMQPYVDMLVGYLKSNQPVEKYARNLKSCDSFGGCPAAAFCR